MAKVLYSAIRIKFPSVPEKEILKVIGNLIYYRYINSAIVAPDACDVIEVNKATGEQALNNEQRKNLGSIAKVLQFAASKKGFGEESAHLMCLNQYIIESHEKLKQFFLECCLVPEPEEEFAMDQVTRNEINIIMTSSLINEFMYCNFSILRRLLLPNQLFTFPWLKLLTLISFFWIIRNKSLLIRVIHFTSFLMIWEKNHLCVLYLVLNILRYNLDIV